MKKRKWTLLSPHYAFVVVPDTLSSLDDLENNLSKAINLLSRKVEKCESIQIYHDEKASSTAILKIIVNTLFREKKMVRQYQYDALKSSIALDEVDIACMMQGSYSSNASLLKAFIGRKTTNFTLILGSEKKVNEYLNLDKDNDIFPSPFDLVAA